MRPCVLVFAGSDPSAGAGIAADVQAIAAVGAHPLAVVTALTVQDHNRVYEVIPVAPDVVLRQAEALVRACRIGAVKIGIPGSADNAHAIAQVILALRVAQPALPVVLDPVLASGHGDSLARGNAVAALAPLLPLATVLTPNGPEAAALATQLGSPDADHAHTLRALGCEHVLVTGGHGGGDEVVNRWQGPGQRQNWSWPRLAGEFHGSGCTLASALAGLLAQEVPMAQALARAQAYTHAALANAYAIGPGQRMPLR
ncbi:bifunctional hydroxymethylpyrimidine kinase/phosphomethylpyrimidine kinase [Pseudoduganella chitinolytica]|uniref:hydroxymethylpyrimidine kinase n=1 Tax=Pseudoduganella chitinolytica TaxID=34070 RepID=A0ABY8BNM6_9BURK|nr:hydroxymethylpyrimidine/phosphomethylpyrimidine kinase [Pseudoduganella chitinolytica]WEF35944.1 hydroxymethylpyrimidine/phosphomethylpyrimidine kinase [Pseudoduganella chitinolytica]